MTMITKCHIFSAVFAAMLSLGAVSAEARVGHYKSYVVKQVQRSITPAEAKTIARRYVPDGRVVDIKRRGDTYIVRVLKKSNKVVDVKIDANTGRVK
jgi:uncharacterized membrane protein YkoI